MSKVLMESLKMDLPALAELLRSKGRGKDSVLAHITPKEAALLKKRGGRGSTNPDTGLLEFDDGFDTTPVAEAPAPVQNPYGGPGDLGFTPSANAPEGTSFNVPFSASTTQPSAPGQDVMPVGVSPETQNAIANYNYGVLPGETGNIGTLNGNVVYPSSGATTPTIQSTPTPGELQSLQAGGPQDLTAQQAVKQPGQQTGYGTKVVNALTDPAMLARLGLATGLGLFGASQARKAANQGQAVAGQEQAIAQPYQTQGQQLVAQAQSGQLSPTSKAALDAAKAQSAQNVANRGGVGAEAEANKIATLTQQLLDNQYKYGLQVMQIGDNISLGAIKTGLQLDTQLNQATTNFYTQLAGIVGGGSSFGGGQTVTLRTA